MNIIYWINKIISSIVIVILIIAFIKFITAYSKESSSSLKEYINKKLDTIFYFFYILFSVYGILNMITSLIEQYMNVSDNADIFNGFALLAFGITLFSIGGSIQQTRKSNEETIQFKNGRNSKLDEISNKLESLNPSNEDLHNEIEKLKEQNQEIIGLLKEKNQTNVHIYVNEEDKNKKTRKNGEYKK